MLRSNSWPTSRVVKSVHSWQRWSLLWFGVLSIWTTALVAHQIVPVAPWPRVIWGWGTYGAVGLLGAEATVAGVRRWLEHGS